MKETLLEEISHTVRDRIKARDIPKSFWEAAVEETSVDLSTHPAFDRWMGAQLGRYFVTGEPFDPRDIAELALSDELLQRRTREAMEEGLKEIKTRVTEKLFDEEIARRIADGSAVEIIMEDGEKGYMRKEDA